MFVADIKEVFLEKKKKKVERNFPLFSKMVSKPVVLVEKRLVCILFVPAAKYIACENSRFFSLLGCFRRLLSRFFACLAEQRSDKLQHGGTFPKSHTYPTPEIKTAILCYHTFYRVLPCHQINDTSF